MSSWASLLPSPLGGECVDGKTAHSQQEAFVTPVCSVPDSLPSKYHAILCLHMAVGRTVLDVQNRDQLRTEPAAEGQIESMQISLSWEFGFGGPYYIAPWVLSAGIGCVQKGLWRCRRGVLDSEPEEPSWARGDSSTHPRC